MEPTTSTHWENIYTTKQAHEVSWTQAIPALSLAFIKAANLDKNAKIIDIGGGTTEIAVIALSGIVCDQSIRVAGDNLDSDIVQYIRRQHNIMIGVKGAYFILTLFVRKCM